MSSKMKKKVKKGKNMLNTFQNFSKLDLKVGIFFIIKKAKCTNRYLLAKSFIKIPNGNPD